MKWNNIVSYDIVKRDFNTYFYNFFHRNHDWFSRTTFERHHFFVLVKVRKKVVAWMSIEYNYILADHGGDKERDEFSHYKLTGNLIKVRRRDLYNKHRQKLPFKDSKSFTEEIYIPPV